MKEVIFYSSLACRFNEFIKMKLSLGYKYFSKTKVLKQLDRLCLDFNDEIGLSKSVVMEWVKTRPMEAATTQAIRIRLVQEFAVFLRQCGDSAYLLPQQKINCKTEFIPYVFSHEQIQRLFLVLDSKTPHIAHPICDVMYSVLFRLLYCCGLRISEALNLQYKDVDLDAGVLSIKTSKFCKDRLVPISVSMQTLLLEYLEKVKFHYPLNNHLFPTRFSDGHVHERCVYYYFRRILWAADIPHKGKHQGPRIHDFRHTFAVHSLEKWINAGVDVQTALPILATYLGHEHIRITQKYLRLTAELYPDILKMIEAYTKDIIPEVSL